MTRSPIASALMVACLAIAGHATSPRAAFPATCASVNTLGLDTSQADTTLLAFHCRGWGEVFLARDTLIRASQCPETAVEANRALARVCRSLRLDSEARAAESRARSRRAGPASGLSFFQGL